jgi:hypothetical protein
LAQGPRTGRPLLSRCTKAHEYLFLLAKSVRYDYDQASILESAGTKAGNKVRKPAGRRGTPDSDPDDPNDGIMLGIGAKKLFGNSTFRRR